MSETLHNPIILCEHEIDAMNKIIEEDNLLPVNLEKRINILSKQIDVLNKGLGDLFRIEDKKNRKARKKLKETALILYNECRISCESVVSMRSMINKLESRVDKLDDNVSLADYDAIKAENIQLKATLKEERDASQNSFKGFFDLLATVLPNHEAFSLYSGGIKLISVVKELKALNAAYESKALKASQRNVDLIAKNSKLLSQINDLKSHISQLQEINLTLSNQVSYHG